MNHPAPDFSIPTHLQTAVAAIRERYSVTPDAIAGELYFLGMPHDQANTVAVDMLVEWACELAMITCVLLHEREPALARWHEVTTAKFELVASRFPILASIDPRAVL